MKDHVYFSPRGDKSEIMGVLFYVLKLLPYHSYSVFFLNHTKWDQEVTTMGFKD